VTLTTTNDSDQQNSITHSVTVDTAPTAAFSPSASVATPNAQLSFDATASAAMTGGSIAHYNWNFGDNTSDDTGSTPTDTHSYSAPGRYTVTLTVTDDLGVSDAITQSVVVDQPNAAFTVPSTFAAPGSAVPFNASGSTDPEGTITDYSWDFGDQSPTIHTGTTATTSHPYATRGTYHVTLTITNDSGQTDVIEHDVRVDTAPTASFTPSASVTTPGSQLSFAATGSTAMTGGSITSYSWDFGDSSQPGSGTTATHTYASPGVYTVSLTVTDDLGIPNTTTHAVTVDAAPTASFAGSPNPATTGPAVSFDGSGSSDTLGTILSYRWDFGDGATGSGATARHAYATPERYTATLTVTNDAGQQSSTSRSITVDAAPTSLFSVSPSAAHTGAPVGFNAGGSNDSIGTITGYNWNFGDGATASGSSTTHTYATPGTYTIALTVTNDANQSSTSSQTVNVYAAPSAAFSVAPAATLTGAPVNFDGSGSGDAGGAITGYSWNFGDGATAGGPSPSHAYSSPGTYTVTLTVTGSLGLVSSTSHSVTVNPPPLSARLSAKRQKLATVLKHGLSVSVSTNMAAKASFFVTIQVRATKHGRPARKHVTHTTNARLLRAGAISFGPGTHTASLRLSRAAADKLRAGRNSVLTLQMTLTDVYGRKLVRSVKLTVSR
jgi:PKD repeat protein